MDVEGSQSCTEEDTADEEDTLQKVAAPSTTWYDILHSRPQTPAPDSADVVIMEIYANPRGDHGRYQRLA